MIRKVTFALLLTIAALCFGLDRAASADPTFTAGNITAGGRGRVLDPTTVNAHTCVKTRQYWGTPGHTGVAWFINSTTTATLTVRRVDVTGTEHAQGASQTVTGGTENVQLVLYPLGKSLLNICNTTGGAATISVDVDEMGGWRIR